MRQALIAGAVALLAAGCATSPRETVLALDTTDRKWNTAECKQARKAAAAFDEHKDGMKVIGLVGNLIVPFAGTATTFAMNRFRDDERAELNHRVRAACTSDPLKGKAGRRVATR